MQIWLSIVLSVFACLPLFAQGSDTRPAFEVASIRRCSDTERGISLSASPGRLSVPCFGLLRLIQEAYHVYADGKPDFLLQPKTAQIEGFPDQMKSYRYAIYAKSASPQTIAMMRGPMLQRLLEERFHLKVHRDEREGPVYILTVAKNGPKLKPTTENSCHSADGVDLITLVKGSGDKPWCGVLTPPSRNGTHYVVDERSVSITSFSKTFRFGGLPVVDHSGLAGLFDIRLEWEFSPPEPASSENAGIRESPDLSIISSFRKQLGLELKPGKGPREVLVVDHLEQPSGN